MKVSLFAFAACLGFLAVTANADYKLANNGKPVVCYADDNQSWNLNKARTKVKYTIEGESLGAREVISKETDGATFVSYTTEEGTLTLSDNGDTYQFAEEDQAWGIDCK